MKPFIFLVGMPGSGKSLLAKKLAAELKWTFADTDAMVEMHAGKSIPEIFSQNGEEAFRQAEQEVYLRLLHGHDKLIVATGGGFPCHSGHMESMLKKGIVIYLQCSQQVLAQRLHKDQHIRPLLHSDTNKEKTLENLLKKRASVYEQAHEILDADKSANELVLRTKEILRNKNYL